MAKRRRSSAKTPLGFTLIELVMVILLIGILSAIAIPEFIDFRTNARNAATQAALGAMRSAIAVSRAAIALKEDPAAAKYPTILEMRGNAFDGSHTNLSGTAIMDKLGGIPQNPWTLSTLPTSHFNSIADCDGQTSGKLQATPADDRGWCYNESSGTIWANSDANSSTPTENAY